MFFHPANTDMKIENKTFLFLFLFFISSLYSCAGSPPEIILSRVPDNGIQPMMVTDKQGNAHLIYFKNISSEPWNREGHIYYRYYLNDSGKWSNAIQISTKPFEQQGAIAKATMAVDKDGRIHVTWLRNNPYEFMYSRSNPQRTEFEPERSLVKDNIEGVEAAASVATYDRLVTLTWHAGDLMQEENRTVYALTSHDNGRTFREEKQIGDKTLGACACCSLAANYSSDGGLMVAYRSAIEGEGRHMQLLTASVNEKNGKSDTRALHEWYLAACPVSTNDFVHNDLVKQKTNQSWLVFETEGKIYQHNTTDRNAEPGLVHVSGNGTRQKYPAIAVDQHGNRLIVWGEGGGFIEGGTLGLQLFDKTNKRQAVIDTSEITITDFSVPAVAALKEEVFLVLY